MPKTTFIHVGVRKARVRKDITQEQLAEKLGVRRTRVVQIESGVNSVSERLLIRLADALELKPSELVALGEPEFEPGSLAQVFANQE